MFTYCLFDEKLNSPEIGEYESNGIVVFDDEGNELVKISDISTERDNVQKLVDLCNKGQADPIHLNEIIENFLLGDMTN